MYTLDSIRQLIDALEARRAHLTPPEDQAHYHACAAAERLQAHLQRLDSVSGQHRSALLRESDLQKQLSAAQADSLKLGFMQLGKRMMAKAEQDNIRKKLEANQQLQARLELQLKQLLAQTPALEEQLSLQLAEVEATEARRRPVAAPAVHPEAPVAPAASVTPPPKAPVAAKTAPVRRSAPAVPRIPRGPRGPRGPRFSEDLPMEEQVSRLMARLEAFYPEHRVFALESISSELRNRLIQLAKRGGYPDTAAFLRAQGWEQITGAQGRALRAGKYCTPGQEPEVIQPRLTSVLHRLEAHYPDRVIPRSIQHDHKSLSQDVAGLYQYLGYPGAAEMLTAYGFRYQVTSGGRPATDTDALLSALRAAYADGARPRSITQVMRDHPEHAHALKTLQNQAPARFGKPLKAYLIEQGVLG